MRETGYMVQRSAVAVARRTRIVVQMRRWLLEGIYYATLLALTVVFALPLVWMLSTSLKTEAQVVELPPRWIPDPIVWQNYPRMWTSAPFDAFYWNSVKVAALNVGGTLFFASLAGYAFARIRFWGRDFMFSVLLSTLMIPGVVTLIPLYVIFRDIGWIDTHYPLWVPGILSNVSSIFLLRQFFKTIPQDLEDAARIDGCSNFGIYARIMIPQVKPALATVGIFTYLGSWNAFLAPLIFINTLEKQTLPMGLALFQTEFYTSVALTMAASTIVTAPVLLVYFFAQRYFIRGITLTGLKG
ncbi:MAG: sugar ABC transporter permease [Litorilinea sp.]|nr:MAG: sugar ABC transporter permease [Litorilinea sp.]